MNDHGATTAPHCRRCDRSSVLILDGLYYCSEHGLIVVLERLEDSELAVAS